MKIASPVIPGASLPESTLSNGLPGYLDVKCYLTSNGYAVTRMKLSFRERLRLLLFGNLWISILAPQARINPFRLDTKPPLDVLVERHFVR